jgi:hypothetical protein
VGTENIFTAELRKILKYKEELLTDDVKRLQKVVADTKE